MPRKRENLIGKRYSRLLVIDYAPDYICKTGKATSQWLCKCDCGNKLIVSRGHLKNSHTQSCGCLQKQRISEIKKTHGMDGTRLHNIWRSMISRCCTKSSGSYNNYGARGIKVCSEWISNFCNFQIWAVKNGYNDDLYLERIDNNGDYCPENCCWISYKAQQRNKRTNHFMTCDGETKTMIEWSEITGINYGTLSNRVNALKWSDEKALKTPIQKFIK